MSENNNIVGKKRKRVEEEEEDLGAATIAKKRKLDNQPPPKSKKPTKRKKKAPPVWKEWKEVFLCGTELEQYDKAFEYDWNFNHLRDMLEDGSLRGNKRFVHIFGTTEPQIIGEGTDVILIPVLVAVLGDIPPPEKLGLTSVMCEKESFLPFSNFKMSWTPHFLSKQNLASRRRKSSTPHVFFLHCNLRKSAMKLMEEKNKVEYQYLLPYMFRPKDLLIENEEDKWTTGVHEVDGRGVHFEVSFASSKEEKTETLNSIMNDYNVSGEGRASLREAMKNTMIKSKEMYESKKKERLEKFSSIPENVRKLMNEVTCVKFYPQNQKDPDISSCKVNFINRYFGKAQTVYPTIDTIQTFGTKSPSPNF